MTDIPEDVMEAAREAVASQWETYPNEFILNMAKELRAGKRNCLSVEIASRAIIADRAAQADAMEAARRYATRLLVSLMEKHYPDRHPKWAPLPDLIGVLTQIDNMSTGLVRARSSSDGEIERFGFIDEASGHEPLFFGSTTGVQPWGISGPEYVKYSDHLADRAAQAERMVRLEDRDLEDAILACERGQTIHDVLANYRAVRRTVQAARASQEGSDA